MKLDIPNDPVTIGLFSAIGIMMIAQDLSHLVHKFQFRVGLKFGLIFHTIGYSHANMENAKCVFPG